MRYFIRQRLRFLRSWAFFNQPGSHLGIGQKLSGQKCDHFYKGWVKGFSVMLRGYITNRRNQFHSNGIYQMEEQLISSVIIMIPNTPQSLTGTDTEKRTFLVLSV